MMVQAQEEMAVKGSNKFLTDPFHTPAIIQPSTSQPQKKQKPKKPKRKNTEVPQPSGPTNNVADEAVYEEMDDSLERAATTATSLDAEHDRVSPRRQDTMGDTIAQTGFENVSKTSNDSLLAGVNTPQSDKDSLKLNEDASKQGRIDDIDANEDIYLVNVHRDEDMFGVNDLEGDEVIVETEVDHEVVVETEVASKDVNLSVDEVTLAQALASLKSAKPKADKAKIDADYQLAQRLQAQEQEELIDEEKARLFIQILKAKKKIFYNKGVSCIDGDDVTVDATPLSTKSPTIVGFKIYKVGKKKHFQIIRADGNSHIGFKLLEDALKNFNGRRLRSSLEHS
ncbi:hypothetical protein Tco_0791023 [Tanacetum coccineum]